MRVLVVSYELPFWPGGGGGHLRHYFLLRELSRRHEIDLVAFEGEVRAQDVEAARQVCHRLVTVPYRPEFAQPPPPPGWLPPSRLALTAADLLHPTPARLRDTPVMPLLADAARDLLQRTRYDAVQVQTTEIANLPLSLPHPSFLSTSDVLSAAMALAAEREPDARRRLRRRLEVLKARRWERRAARRYDHVFCVSEPERERLQDLGLSRVTVVPEGVATDVYLPTDPNLRDQTTVLLLANFEYGPNVDSAEWMVGEILPRLRSLVPGVRLRLVGRGGDRSLAHLGGPGVEITGFVHDERPEIAAAGAVVIPARLGLGIRLKVPLLWATGSPFVSTTLGAHGYDLARDGTNLLLADSAGDFAQAVARLLGDPDFARELGRAGRVTAEQHYSWAASARIMEEGWAQA